MKNDQPPTGGQFAAGFFLGSVAGIASLFLFGTKQGRQLVKSFQEEMKNENFLENVVEKIENLTDEKTLVKKAKRLPSQFPKFQRKSAS